MREVLIGQTDYTVLVKIVGTDGAPESGLTEASIDLAYSRVETDNDVTTADVTPAALTALTDAHTDWGFEEVSSTDHPGLYRLDIADAVFASGAWEAVVTITDASGTDFYAVDIGFRLVAFNPLDGVRLGLTALPNAAADAAGGLPISDAGGLDLDARIGTDIPAILVDTAEIGAAGVGLTNINLPNQTMDIVGNITGNLSGSVGSVTAAVTLPTIPTAWITADGIATDALGAAELAAGWATEIADAVLSRNVSNVETTMGEHTLGTIILLGLEADMDTTPGSLLILGTDGTTTRFTKTLTTDAAAEPITKIA
jgi:hypothetical protein